MTLMAGLWQPQVDRMLEQYLRASRLIHSMRQRKTVCVLRGHLSPPSPLQGHTFSNKVITQNRSKTAHKLGAKYSNTRAYEGHCHSSYYRPPYSHTHFHSAYNNLHSS